MDEKKIKKAKVQVIFSTLIFTLLFFLEIYAMINHSKTYVLIGGIAVAALIALFFTVNGIVEMIMRRNHKQEEQLDSLYRSDKASYIMSKKNFEEIAEQLEQVQRSAALPMQEIVSVQKGIAKVIINRNRENADAIINSNELLIEQVNEFEDKLGKNNKEIIDEEKAISKDMVQQLIDKQQEIIVNLKDMELRLNTSIMQSQKMLAEQKAMMNQPQFIQQPYVQPAPAQPIPAPSIGTPEEETVTAGFEEIVSEEEINQETIEVAVLEEEPLLTEFEETAAEELPEETVLEEEATLEEEPLLTEFEETAAEELPEEVVLEEEATLEEEPLLTEFEETAAEELPEEVGLEETAEEAPIEETAAEEAPAEEEKPPMPDLSDPNKKMDPDDIAALIANMNAEESQADSEGEAETEEVAIEETAEEAPAVEEKPPMPDLSDPNKKMDPDDIAALIANMTAEEKAPAEPEPAEEKPPMPDLSDPNKKMNDDDIAALIANMTAEEDTPAPAEPEPEEEKPPMPDLSDPNKKLSPDEIAALFANA